MPDTTSNPLTHSQSTVPKPPFHTIPEAVKDQHIWLSGGIGAIGLSICQSFLTHPCGSLHVTDILPPETGLETLQSTLHNPHNTKLTYQQIDVTNTKQLTTSILPHHTVIVCAAGIANEHDFRQEMDVNAFGVVNSIQATLVNAAEEDSQKRLQRVVIVISSAAGVFPFSAAPGYTMSKFAAVGFTQAVARKAWKLGVRIVTLCPSIVDGGMGLWADNQKDDIALVGILRKEDVADMILELIRRRDVVGKVVYMSKKAGVRMVRVDIRNRFDSGIAKL